MELKALRLLGVSMERIHGRLMTAVTKAMHLRGNLQVTEGLTERQAW